MFVGPFVPGDGWAEDTTVLRHPLADSSTVFKRRASAKFRTLSRSEADNLMNLASLLAEGIQNALAVEPRTKGVSRQELVKLFFDREFARSDLRLDDLASWLGLSYSRCGQLLKQYFGKGFPELLTERRMEHARLLLPRDLLQHRDGRQILRLSRITLLLPCLQASPQRRDSRRLPQKEPPQRRARYSLIQVRARRPGP